MISISIADGRSSFFRYDTGRQVLLTGIPVGTEINFALPGMTDSLTTVATQSLDSVVADVPDQLLTSSKTPLLVYAYVTDETGCMTQFKTFFNIVNRAKPTGYVGDPTKAETWAQLKEQLAALQAQVDEIEQNGTPGQAAGFGTITATATQLAAGEQPTASVEASGPDTSKDLLFSFGIPSPSSGNSGESGDWKLIRTVTAPEDPTTDQSGVAWIVDDSGGIIGFSFETDESGAPFEFQEVMFGATGDFTGTTANFVVLYSNKNSINFYKNAPTKASSRLLFLTNRLDNNFWNPQLIVQQQFVGGSATVAYPYNGSITATQPISPIQKWTKFYIETNPVVMSNFKFDVYGR